MPSIVDSSIMDITQDAAKMPRKRCIVGVIGGDESSQVDAALRVGGEVAKAHQIILTGGTPVDTDDVKNAALWGAHQAEKKCDPECVRACSYDRNTQERGGGVGHGPGVPIILEDGSFQL